MAKTSRPVQIKSLPRTGEPPVPEASEAGLQPKHVVIGAAVLLVLMIYMWDDRNTPKPMRPLGMPARQLEDGTPEARVNQFLAETAMKERMAEQSRDLENRISAKPLNAGDTEVPENKRPLGVTLDQEGAADRVYRDIYGPDRSRTPQTPQERINRMVEENHWMNQLEKQQRKAYVENFLKEAADAGYAIDLDENLVVVRVRKITAKPTKTLDQVLDDLARKGM